MSEDELLRALGRWAREDSEAERARLDERWDALAAGTLAPDEIEELRRLADSSPAAAAAWAAFQPLDETFRERVAAAIRSEESSRATAPIGGEPPAPVHGVDSGPRLKPPADLAIGGRAAARETPAATVRHFPGTGERRRRPPWHWALPVGALLAASLFVWTRVAAPPPLLPYHLAVEGGVKTYRSEEPAAGPAALPLAPGNRLLLTLTPESAIEGDVTARLYLVRDGTGQELTGAQIEVAPGGSVRLTGVIGREIPLPRGDADLVIAVGRPGDLPEPQEALVRLGEAATAGSGDWQLWRLPVRLEPDA